MEKTTVDEKTNIKITVHIPDDVPEVIKQQKINYLYDLLKPICDKDNEKITISRHNFQE